MIAACTSRFAASAEPVVWRGATEGDRCVALFDGSGSWGTGVAAARWFREGFTSWIARETQVSPASITARLAAMCGEVPAELAQDAPEWGWAFAVCVVLVRGGLAYVAATGGFAAVVVREGEREVRAVVTPRRLVDEFVATGAMRAEEAAAHPHARVLLVPLFGEKNTELVWNDAVPLRKGERLVVGDASLPRSAGLLRDDLVGRDVVALRDALEAHGGRSSPTAVLSLG